MQELGHVHAEPRAHMPSNNEGTPYIQRDKYLWSLVDIQILDSHNTLLADHHSKTWLEIARDVQVLKSPISYLVLCDTQRSYVELPAPSAMSAGCW